MAALKQVYESVWHLLLLPCTQSSQKVPSLPVSSHPASIPLQPPLGTCVNHASPSLMELVIQHATHLTRQFCLITSQSGHPVTPPGRTELLASWRGKRIGIWVLRGQTRGNWEKVRFQSLLPHRSLLSHTSHILPSS